MLENVEKVQERLKSKLTPKRYIHTTGVRYTAAALAMRYGLSVEDASMAGVLHDCAKCFSDDELVRKCLKNNLECTELELLEAVRRMAFVDIDEAVYQILDRTLGYLGDKAKTDNNGREIDIHTVEAFKYYRQIHVEKDIKF